MNPELVRFLIERGAIPRTHVDNPMLMPPTLYAVYPPLWLSHPGQGIPGSKPPFETTLEAWDAYAADMIGLIARRWPDPAYSKMFEWLERTGQTRSIAALRAAGVSEPPPEENRCLRDSAAF